MKIAMQLNPTAGTYLIVEEAFAATLADVLANSRIAIATFPLNKTIYAETEGEHFVPEIKFIPECDIQYLHVEGEATE